MPETTGLNVLMRRKWVMAQVRTQELEALQSWRPLVKRLSCTQIRPSQSLTARRQHPWFKEDKTGQQRDDIPLAL
jgi:hypothetical protein